MALHLAPGKSIKRTALHRRYGGRKQGGISPSRKSANVFLFTDPKRGVLHGYIYEGCATTVSTTTPVKAKAVTNR